MFLNLGSVPPSVVTTDAAWARGGGREGGSAAKGTRGQRAAAFMLL